jgi:glycosyltransferase involved in cell wall biosynthesis
MRILQLVAYYPPAWGYGGPPRVMYSLARALVGRGHAVTVYTTDAWDETRRVPERERDLDGVRVVSFPNLSNSLAWRRKTFWPVGLIPRLRASAHEFDVAHISAVRSLLHARLHRTLRRRLPYVIDAHGAMPRPAGWRRFPALAWDPLILRPFLRDAAVLLAQTPHEGDLYRAHLPDGRIEQLPLPLDLHELDRHRPAGTLRTRLGIGPDTLLMLFLGRIERRKGVDFLVRGFAEFARRATVDARLALVGRDAGALAEVLAVIAALGLNGKATFVGPMYDEARLAAYADADVFVLTPPYWEETSLAALEAAASGVPCVMTPQAEIPGLATAGGCLTVPFGDVPALATALERLAAPERRREHGMAAAAHVRSTFAAEAVAARFEAIVSRAMRSPGCTT